MRILLYTRFHPNVGGIETVAWLLAHEWQRLGEPVTVVSDVACPLAQRREFSFPVHHRPSIKCWLGLMRQADVFVHMNISLRALWPLALVRRPFVAVHHGFYVVDRTGRQDWRERLKLKLMAGAKNIAVSEAVARRLPVPSAVIPNPYDDTLFRCDDEEKAKGEGQSSKRDCALVFVGRLVSDKGTEILLMALGSLHEQGLYPALTIIGDGPERAALEQLAKDLKIEDQVLFVGAQPQQKVAEMLRCHEIMVVPSLWEEPFGVVVLEGAACGCVVLGSDGGGLPEAIGPTGITFKRGDLGDLVLKLAHLLQYPGEWIRHRAAAPAHLAKHQPREVAARYLEVLRKAA